MVYKVDPSSNETVLLAFSGETDGGGPNGGMVRDGRGNLYGTTAGAGQHGDGVAFRLSGTGLEVVLHSFDGSDGSDSQSTLFPFNGYLYGTTAAGGAYGQGVVFKVSP